MKRVQPTEGPEEPDCRRCQRRQRAVGRGIKCTPRKQPSAVEFVRPSTTFTAQNPPCMALPRRRSVPRLAVGRAHLNQHGFWSPKSLAVCVASGREPSVPWLAALADSKKPCRKTLVGPRGPHMQNRKQRTARQGTKAAEATIRAARHLKGWTQPSQQGCVGPNLLASVSHTKPAQHAAGLCTDAGNAARRRACRQAPAIWNCVTWEHRPPSVTSLTIAIEVDSDTSTAESEEETPTAGSPAPLHAFTTLIHIRLPLAGALALSPQTHPRLVLSSRQLAHRSCPANAPTTRSARADRALPLSR